MEQNLKFDRKRNRVKYCPCGRSNRDGKFAPYQGYENKGYCHSCGETFLPEIDKDWANFKPYTPPETSYHDFELVGRSMNKFKENNFVQFLKTIFTEDEVKQAILKYLIGTSSHWEGATVFWQIDNNEKVRHGKIMLYNRNTGKRFKDTNGKAYINSVRSKLKLEDFSLKQCLFGLHLINETESHTVAIVESEKTAIIMSLFKPEYVWLATGSKQGFKYEMMNPVKRYKIIAFPDKSECSVWQSIASELNSSGFDITVSGYLEGTDYPGGTDLADVYIDEMYGTYAEEPTEHEEPAEEPKRVVTNTEQAINKLAEVNPAIRDLVTAFGLTDSNGQPIGDEPEETTEETPEKEPQPNKLNWRRLQDMPLEVKQGVIKARTEGHNRAKIKDMFPQLTPREIDLILDPAGGGAHPSEYKAM